jgi:hypothetical protein
MLKLVFPNVFAFVRRIPSWVFILTLALGTLSPATAFGDWNAKELDFRVYVPPCRNILTRHSPYYSPPILYYPPYRYPDSPYPAILGAIKGERNGGAKYAYDEPRPPVTYHPLYPPLFPDYDTWRYLGRYYLRCR